MLTIAGLSKSFGGRELFDDVSLTLQSGERVGLVGPNGAGKSTLLKIILGRETPDAGEVTVIRGTRFGYLPQESEPAGNESVLDVAVPHDHEHDGQFVARAKQILAHLGFQQTDFDRQAGELSGGWVMRAHLARLLAQEPDLLMLDEPTNHLDLETLLWFQEYLRHYPGAILLISHDREFLNQLCTHVAELRQARLFRYTGNYDEYLIQRAATEATLVATAKARDGKSSGCNCSWTGSGPRTPRRRRPRASSSKSSGSSKTWSRRRQARTPQWVSAFRNRNAAASASSL